MAKCIDSIQYKNFDEDALIKFWSNSEFKKPKLIIFDLDFTFWPYFANRYYQLPFKKILNDQNTEYIIDGKNKKITYFNDVPKIIKTLKENCFQNGEKLAIASRSGQRKTVIELLE